VEHPLGETLAGRVYRCHRDWPAVRSQWRGRPDPTSRGEDLTTPASRRRMTVRSRFARSRSSTVEWSLATRLETKLKPRDTPMPNPCIPRRPVPSAQSAAAAIQDSTRCSPKEVYARHANTSPITKAEPQVGPVLAAAFFCSGPPAGRRGTPRLGAPAATNQHSVQRAHRRCSSGPPIHPNDAMCAHPPDADLDRMPTENGAAGGRERRRYGVSARGAPRPRKPADLGRDRPSGDWCNTVAPKAKFRRRRQ